MGWMWKKWKESLEEYAGQGEFYLNVSRNSELFQITLMKMDFYKVKLRPIAFVFTSNKEYHSWQQP